MELPILSASRRGGRRRRGGSRISMKLDLGGSGAAERWRHRGRRLLEFVQAVWVQLGRDKVIIRASGLAYASLLSVVPLAAVVFALFSAFGAFDEIKQKIQSFLLTTLLPSGQDQIMDAIDAFIANSSDLGFIGFATLIVTAILLLDNVDWNFNDMWHVSRRRSLISRVMAYTSVLVFGAVLIGLSVTISARIRSALFSDGINAGGLGSIGSFLFPLVASFLAFLIMFIIIPSTKVCLPSAAIGAGFSAVTWELGKNLFAASIGQSVRYSTLYGSLAAVPIFLIWLYITWILVLIGVEIAYTHQNYTALVRAKRVEPPTGRERLALAVAITAVVARRFETGEPPPTESDLVERLGVASSAVDAMAERLEEAGLLRRVGGEDDDHGLVPARSIDQITVVDVLGAVWGDGRPAALGLGDGEEDGALPASAVELVRTFESGGREAVGEVTFRELVKRGSTA